jgi:hypothetical protein
MFVILQSTPYTEHRRCSTPMELDGFFLILGYKRSTPTASKLTFPITLRQSRSDVSGKSRSSDSEESVGLFETLVSGQGFVKVGSATPSQRGIK